MISVIDWAIVCWFTLGQWSCPISQNTNVASQRLFSTLFSDNPPEHIEPKHIEPMHIEPMHIEPMHIEPMHIEPIRLWLQEYNQVADDLYASVLDDHILFSSSPNQRWTRSKLCEVLSDRHRQYHHDFVDSFPNNADCLTTLQPKAIAPNHPVSKLVRLAPVPNGSPENPSLGWALWAGYHRGTWFTRSGGAMEDNAYWRYPEYRPSLERHPSSETIIQAVRFEGAHRQGIAQYGWNQSDGDRPYLRGFDPKHRTMDPTLGVHIGFSFSTAANDLASYPAHSCILWVTTYDAFLECINANNTQETITQTDNAPQLKSTAVSDHYRSQNYCSRNHRSQNRRRTSTSLFEYGQWIVHPLAQHSECDEYG